jgi:hypothetical protein
VPGSHPFSWIFAGKGREADTLMVCIKAKDTVRLSEKERRHFIVLERHLIKQNLSWGESD